ncbi:MAG: hypothetical protein ACK55I_23810, partial [bacterium]
MRATPHPAAVQRDGRNAEVHRHVGVGARDGERRVHVHRTRGRKRRAHDERRVGRGARRTQSHRIHHQRQRRVALRPARLLFRHGFTQGLLQAGVDFRERHRRFAAE